MKVTVLSGSRADQGALETVCAAMLKRDLTVVFEKIAVLADPDSRKQVALSAAFAAEDVAGLYPTDLVMLLGDRYEVLAAATSAYLLGYPIAHLSGGDITEGSQDDSMRHAITKLSHLHFVTNEESALRVLQMGEEPWRVHNVGCPAIDTLEWVEPPDLDHPYILVVWHPNTLGDTGPDVFELVNGLNAVPSNVRTIVIGPNADAGNNLVRGVLREWAKGPNREYHENLPRSEYLAFLKGAMCLVGNSSSGLYEAPSFNTPVLNIGDRQKGRMLPANVLYCTAQSDAIAHCLEAILLAGRPKVKIINPYGDGQAADRIADVVCSIKNPQFLLRKGFYDIRRDVGVHSPNTGLGAVPERTVSKVGDAKLWWNTNPVAPTDQNTGYWMWPGGRNPLLGP